VGTGEVKVRRGEVGGSKILRTGADAGEKKGGGRQVQTKTTKHSAYKKPQKKKGYGSREKKMDRKAHSDDGRVSKKLLPGRGLGKKRRGSFLGNWWGLKENYLQKRGVVKNAPNVGKPERNVSKIFF